MSLVGVRDEFLASRAGSGDERAFAELARRYDGLLRTALRYRSVAIEPEDLHQEALIGLHFACRSFDRARGCRFASWAKRCVHQAILRNRRSIV